MATRSAGGGVTQTQPDINARIVQVPEGLLDLHPRPIARYHLIGAHTHEVLGCRQEPRFLSAGGMLATGGGPNRMPQPRAMDAVCPWLPYQDQLTAYGMRLDQFTAPKRVGVAVAWL